MAYPYAPPPPAPSTASPSPYPAYAQGQGQGSAYNHTSRGGHSQHANGGRARGHPGHQHQGPGRSEYGAPYYQQQEYASPVNQPYSSPQSTAYWEQSAPHMNHHHPPASPLPPAGYSPTPNYPTQGYAHSPAQGYQAQYPAQSPRPSYGAAYGQPPNDYPQRWAEQGPTYASYPSRGGRAGYQTDRGGHKSDHAMGTPLRMGFDQRHDHSTSTSAAYGQPYPHSNHQPTPYQQPAYSYPPVPAPPFAGSSHATHAPSNRGGHDYGRGRGRGDGAGHSHRGGRFGGNGDRGDKFRNRDHRPQQGPNNHQKSDAASSKKKKRKTNTLGLTPGDGDSEDGLVDEEKRLEELLGPLPSIANMSAYIAERRANYPTKARAQARLQAKKDAGPANSGNSATTEVDRDLAEADRLRKKLAKVERKLEKRKRATNDEGDDMRASSGSSDEDSEDEKPETMGTGKTSNAFLPPPPISRADPTNHCKYYVTGGSCGKKSKCRFVHDPARREIALQARTRNGGKMTLKQRLMLNEAENSEVEVVKAIIELREKGRLEDPENPPTPTSIQHPHEHAPSAGVTTLPTTPGAANLPPNPYSGAKKTDPTHKVKSESQQPYKNWYLGGFSNKNQDLQPRQLP
ncbi:Uu.00g016020.m01.CDS01 [Anthostomella pinea]|uniref:Uu.00g016020.m01.CDS01 n=1 Tax=Anthostomella pinea TaxID=933095 RepID=A0AAI8VZV1_9PEZI|nr:Uu.00g016020.m01.CDS01 [Anthostomella pinea]